MTDPVLYSVVDKQVVVTDLRSGATLWTGQPLGYPVWDLLQVPGTATALVLLHPDAELDVRFENLVCISEDGSINWKVSLPIEDPVDTFVAINFDEEGVTANTWSGYRVVLDPANGVISHIAFTK